MPGARCTRRLVCKGRSRKHTSSTGSPKSPGIPARNGFTAYIALSPAIGLSCHRRLRIKGVVRPVGLATPPQT
jgi:hypothetical protein